MLSPHLEEFNNSLSEFQSKFPRPNWSDDFKIRLINDFSFFSTKLEDEKLVYGDTLKFLNGQLVKKGKMSSLLEVSNHKDVLESIINRYDNFEITEESIKSIHKDLMSSPLSWDSEFSPILVGEYRNIPTVGNRQPHFKNKEYAPHYNLNIVMASHIGMFKNALNNIDNSDNETHLITRLAYFHNIFLNKIHPFADGNGRVCRIVMGTIMMKNDCPPIFHKIMSEEDRFEYINTVIECETSNSNEPLIKFLSKGMSAYMLERVSEQ